MIGDFNAKVGSDTWQCFGLGGTNEWGLRLLEFAQSRVDPCQHLASSHRETDRHLTLSLCVDSQSDRLYLAAKASNQASTRQKGEQIRVQILTVTTTSSFRS